MYFAFKSGADIVFYDKEGNEKLKNNVCNSLKIESIESYDDLGDKKKAVFILLKADMVDYKLLDLVYNNEQNSQSDFEKSIDKYETINISETLNTEVFKIIVEGIRTTEEGVKKQCKIIADECQFVSLDYLQSNNILTLSSEEVSQFDFAIQCFQPKGSKDFIKIMLEK